MKTKKRKLSPARKRLEKPNRLEDLQTLTETIGMQWKRSNETQRHQLLLIVAMTCNALVAASD